MGYVMSVSGLITCLLYYRISTESDEDRAWWEEFAYFREDTDNMLQPFRSLLVAFRLENCIFSALVLIVGGVYLK